MELFSDLIKILIPATLVLYGMYITVKSFIDGQKSKAILESKMESRNTSIPMRLQAYERICLLLERIRPSNLLLRLNGKAVNVADFQQVLLNEIREEFNHNLSQQVYMSDMAWNHTRNAVEQTLSLVNDSTQNLDQKANGVELSKSILKSVINQNNNSIEMALAYIKNELRQELY